MSMDRVFQPYSYHYISPPINVAKFRDEAWDAENEFYKFFHGEDRKPESSQDRTRESFERFAAVNEIKAEETDRAINTVVKGIGSVVEKYPIVDFEPTFPPSDSPLHSHWVLNDMRENMQHKLRSKSKYNQRSKYYGYSRIYFNRPLNPSRNDVEKDVVVTVSFLRPQNLLSNDMKVHHMGLRKEVEAKYVALGKTTLRDLKQKIFCQADFWCNKQDFEEATDSENYFLKKYPSSFIFIYDTFYADFSNPEAKDISIKIREFIKRKSLGLKEPKLVDINEVRVEDLTFRLGQPYVYVHQGHCEHLLVFSDLRLKQVHDNPNESFYPSLVYDNTKSIECGICSQGQAIYVVTESDRMPENPSFMCGECFRGFHYERNLRLGEFTAYHYIDKGAIL